MTLWILLGTVLLVLALWLRHELRHPLDLDAPRPERRVFDDQE